MAALRLILCTIIAGIWFCSLINAAVVHNLIHTDQLADDRAESLITFPDSIRSRRSIDLENSAKICYNATPCGWAVYVRFTRVIEYFMQNTCHCPSPMRCIRTDDDLSVSAYVYRCRSNVSETDIQSPEDSN